MIGQKQKTTVFYRPIKKLVKGINYKGGANKTEDIGTVVNVNPLLERQVPQTAGAVRGLARWSVQQRLEHQLGDTVGHLIVDLENLIVQFIKLTGIQKLFKLF